MTSIPLKPLRLAVLLAAALSPLRAAPAGEATVQVDVLRAEAAGDLLDVLLRVEVHGEDRAPLGPDDFAAYIAPAELPAEEAEQPQFRVSRIFLKRLRGAYYLDLRRLPPGAGSGQCQLVLRVSRQGAPGGTGRVGRLLAARSDTLDVVLLIDESLSMLRTDPKRRRIQAAKTFVDLAYRSSRIARVGIVAFNEEARTLVPLTSLANIDALHQAIERIGAWGQTDMDGSLDLARSLLERQDAPTAKAVVLLTDGKDEPGRYEGAHERFARRRWRVFTVGLSERADHDVLRRIARDTGGAYHDAPTSAQLQDIFGRICLTLQKQVAIRSRRLELPAGETRREPFPVDETISSMTVRLQADAGNIGFALRNPADKTLEGGGADLPRRVAYARKGGHQYFNISRPWPGQWTARLNSPQAAEADLAMSAATPLLLRAFPLKATYYRGEPVELAVSLASLDAVLDDARVEAHLTDAAGRTETLPLHDDGQHGDTRPADGVFAAVYPGSDEPGTLGIRLVAAGTSPGGHRFERELSRSVPVRPEGPSKLWAAEAGLDFGVVYNGETVGRNVGVKLTSNAREPALETVGADIELPVADGEDGRQVKLLPHELHLEPQPLTLEPGQLQRVRLTLTIPAQQPEGRYQGKLRLTSRTDKVAVPVTIEVRHPKLAFDAETLDLGRVEPGGTTKAPLPLRLEPRGKLPVRLSASSPHLRLPAEPLAIGPEPVPAEVILAPPKDAEAGTFSAKLTASTPLGRTELPVRAQIVRPSLAVTPEAVDFGEARPGTTAEAQLALKLDGLKPQSAEFASKPLAADEAPSLSLNLPDGAVELSPEDPAKVTLRLRVPPVQPPGTYRGAITVQTPLGKQSVPATARVPAAATFRVAGPLDLGRLAIGSAREAAVEVESLVDAPQTVRVSLPEPSAGRQFTAAPTEVELPAGGRAEVSLRLAASEGAAPGKVEETVQLRGPSQDARADVRATLFRPPHQSLAFEPAELDVGYLLPGLPAEFTASVRSLVDEEQSVALESVESESKAVQVSAELAESRLAARGSVPLAITVAPQVEPQRVTPFEATVRVRGRSQPASLRVRGAFLPPPGTTVAIEPSALDFGSMRPGENRTRSLTVRSRFRREQDVSVQADAPKKGISLTPWPAELVLPAKANVPVDIGLSVAEDAEPGARRIIGRVSGPGESAEFEVTVEVVSPAPPPVVATGEPLGWQEWLVLLALILALLLALLLLYLYIRWLLRSRAPRPVKVFTASLALSGLLHALLLSASVDIFWQRGEPDRPGVGVKVALRNIAGSVFSSRKPSVADELQGRRESERQVEATRRQGEASELSRKQAEARRRKLAAAKAKLDRAEAKLDRAEAKRQARLSERKRTEPKLTVEDLDRVMEQVREAERVKETQETRSVESAATDAARVAQLRDMSREQLEAAVERVLEPKTTKTDRSAQAAPPAPDLSQQQPVEKTAAPDLDKLLPAMEELKQQAAKADATRPSAAGPKQVRSERAARGPDLARAAPQAPKAAGAPSAPASAAESPAARSEASAAQPEAALSGGETAPAEERAAVAFDFATPQESVGQPGEQEQPTPATGGTAGEEPGPAQTAPTRAASGAPSGGRRRAPAAAQPSAAGAPSGESSATAASRPPASVAPQPAVSSGGGASGRAAAPPSFRVPDEAASASDPLVELPGGATSEGEEAEPVAVSRAPAGAQDASRRPTPAMGAGRPRMDSAQGTAGSASARAPATAEVALPGAAAPTAEKRAAGPRFDAPTEAPGTEERVAEPPREGTGPAEVEASDVDASRRAAHAATGAERGRATARPSGAREPEVPATARASQRPASPSGKGVPDLAAATATDAKAAPEFGQEAVELVEGPLVEPRRRGAPEEGGATERTPGPRTLVARWRGRRRGTGIERARLAAAQGGASAGDLDARATSAGRRPGSTADLGELTAGPRSRGHAMDEWEGGVPQETAVVHRGAAEARQGRAGEASARAVTAGRRQRGPAAERPGRASAPTAASSGIDARQAPAARRSARASAPLEEPAGGTDEKTAAPAAEAVADALPGEAVSEGQRLAAAGPKRGLSERRLAPGTPGGARGRAADRLARPSPSPRAADVGPRATIAQRTPVADASRLLLPVVGAETRRAGSPFGTRGGTSGTFILTTGRYGSGHADWDTHDTALQFLAWQLRERIGFNIETRIRTVPLDSLDLFDAPWVYISGHKNFRLPADQVANLRRYLLAGGTLWADDSTHESDHTWDTAFRREIARVLPPDQGYRLRKITQADDHPLFRACFDLRQGFADYFPPPGDKYRQNYIEGIEIDGRLAVIYTRNDYGDGLEIRPDTFPLKASLSGLSPAEMQESSFLMACNIVLYAITGGQAGKQRFADDASRSLQRHRAAQQEKPDPYADAPAVVFEDFSEPRWQEASGEWDSAGPATLDTLRPKEPDAQGRRLAVRFRLRDDQAKVVLLREVPAEADFSDQDRLYVDLESRLNAGARLSVALITLPGWKYYESVPAFIKPGRNRVHFELQKEVWKTGEPVPEGQSEYARRPANLHAVRRVALLLYPMERSGTVVVDRIELRAKPHAAAPAP